VGVKAAVPRLALGLLALLLGLAACGAPGATNCRTGCVHPNLSTLDLLAGQLGGQGWVDGSLAAAHFADPWALLGDGHGHLYLADGQTLRAVDLAGGTVSTLAGSFGVVGGSDGPGPQTTVNTPSGLALYQGALYFTDTENHTLRKIDLGSGVVSTVAGVFEQPGAVDAVGTAARFQEPEGLALDGSGNLYIGDTDNNTVRAMSLATGAVTTLAGTAGVSGSDDGVGAAARFDKPKAMVWDGGANLIVIDSVNNSLRRVEIASGTVSTLVTLPTLPQGLTFDGADLLVSLADDRLVRVDGQSGVVTPLAGAAGQPGFADGTDARLDYPAGLFNDGAGTVYIADEGNAALRTLTLSTSSVATYAGAKSSGSADGAGGDARFFAPQGLAAGDDALYVADTTNNTIRKVVTASGETTTVAGLAGAPGSADGAAGDARFNAPEGLALDGAAQLLYVADSNNRRLRRIDLGSGLVTTLSPQPAAGDAFTSFDSPAGLALDGGRLFVADYGNDALFAVDLDKGLVSTLAGRIGTPGSSDGVGGKAGFYGPLGLAADGRGNLYVSDDLNHTVRKVALASGAVTTLAGQAATPGTSDGTGSAAQFQYPAGLTANSVGDLFVADSLNNTVRHIDAAGGAVTTVIGTLHASGVRLGALPAQLTHPATLILTPAATLVVVSENSLLLAH
jgi:sugar lactone lactonase YvrE